jgi:putative transposase
MSLDSIVRIIKSLTARQIFQYFPDIKKELWGGNLWTSGYYANTVGQYGNMEVIRKYVENQGRQYKQIHSQQLTLW